ncbi:MAG: efflux RND transporter permease subunit [Inquilinus sp.]|nr:efflux RND transporter permease subunit [Inquilinus sp.]
MIPFFARHPTASNLLMVLLFALGLVALPTLRRETFPDFSTDAVRVAIAYPGATAEEVEEAICQRIEEAVEGLTDLGEVRCEARESLGSATIEMAEGGDINGFLTNVKTEIDAIDSFPEVAEDPVIEQINMTDLVVSVAITGPMAEPDLKVFAEEVKDRLTRLPEVSQVEILGFSDRQIRIELDTLALRQYGLSVADIAAIVERQSIDLPSGTIETGERDVLVRFADRRQSPLEFADLAVVGGDTGAQLRLGQIATITDRFEADEQRVLFNGQRGAILQVTKTKQQDTLTVVGAVRDFVAAEQQRAPPGVTFTLTRDVASIVEDRLSMLTGNGIAGLVLVFLVLWLFFSLRYAFWVAMGLPASFLGALFVMTLLGLSIDMLTMVGLLIAIGLLMDDSIVIAENIATKVQQGLKPLAAAIEGTREVALGVVSSFITSICVFTPLAFLAGDIGKVLRVLPVVLIATLSVSLIEAFLILPHHIAHALKHERRGRFRDRFDAGFARLRDRVLGPIVDTAVTWRYLTIGLVVMAFLASISMLAGGVLKFRAFPDLDGDVIEARILLPQGTPLARTEAVVAQVTTALERVDAAFTPDQPDGAALVRNVMIRFGSNADAFESGAHLATVTADLLQAERRNARVGSVLNLWREEVGEVSDVVALSFKEPQVGPAGVPIEIRLQGDDLGELKAAALALQEWLSRYRGVEDLQDDLRPGKPEIRLALREGSLGLGLDAAAIAGQLRAAYHGRTAAEIQVGAESFEIDVRLTAADQDSLADLDYFTVTLPNGGQVPLSAVATAEPGRGVARIQRIEGRRTVTLRGEVDGEIANVNEIIADTTARFLPELTARHPGVDIQLEGQAAEQAETGASLRRGFLIGMLGVFLLLSFQFRSYAEPVIVMLAIPLAMIGVVWGHIGMGLELSMPSMMGMASLAGIVVNDSILMVAFVKRNAYRGMKLVEAARQASRDRFRPVLLTSVTTIAGLLPLLFERSLQAQVLVPLVTSIAFGLLASTVLVLVVVPSAYAVLHDFGLTTVAREETDEPPERAPSPAE